MPFRPSPPWKWSRGYRVAMIQGNGFHVSVRRIRIPRSARGEWYLVQAFEETVGSTLHEIVVQDERLALLEGERACRRIVRGLRFARNVGVDPIDAWLEAVRTGVPPPLPTVVAEVGKDPFVEAWNASKSPCAMVEFLSTIRHESIRKVDYRGSELLNGVMDTVVDWKDGSTLRITVSGPCHFARKIREKVPVPPSVREILEFIGTKRGTSQ